MHLFHIPEYIMQNRNVSISVLNGVLWNMEQVHYGICEIGLLQNWYFCKGGSIIIYPLVYTYSDADINVCIGWYGHQLTRILEAHIKSAYYT